MNNKELIGKLISFEDEGIDVSTGYVSTVRDGFNVEGIFGELFSDNIFKPLAAAEDFDLIAEGSRDIIIGLAENWDYELVIDCDRFAEKPWLTLIGCIKFGPENGDWDEWTENPEGRTTAMFYLKGKPDNIEKVMPHIGGDFQNVNFNVLGTRLPKIAPHYINEVWDPTVRILGRMKGDKTFVIGSGDPNIPLEISNTLSIIAADTVLYGVGQRKTLLTSVTIELESNVSFRENVESTTLSLDFGDYEVDKLNIITNGVDFSYLEIGRGFTPKEINIDDYNNVSGFRWYMGGGYSAPVQLSRIDNSELMTDDEKWEQTAKSWLSNVCRDVNRRSR